MLRPHLLKVRVQEAHVKLFGREATPKELKMLVDTVPLSLSTFLNKEQVLPRVTEELEQHLKHFINEQSSDSYLKDLYMRERIKERNIQRFLNSIFSELTGGATMEESEYLVFMEAMPDMLKNTILNYSNTDLTPIRNTIGRYMFTWELVHYRRRKNGLTDEDAPFFAIEPDLMDLEIKELQNVGAQLAFSRFVAEGEAIVRAKRLADETNCITRIIAIVNSSNMSQDDSDELMGEIDNLRKILKGEMI